MSVPISGRACAAVLLALAATAAAAACPPAGVTRAELDALAAARWSGGAADDTGRRQALALGLLDCLADPDPALRDGIAFEALQAWMRADRLDEPTVRAIHRRLAADLAGPADADGFRQPFAALALAEVARVDRLKPFLGADERRALVERAASYLAGVRDYRGWEPGAGWRHGVAHGADLVLQLALNPALDPAMGERLRAAVAAQVLPAGEQFWRFGEAERLMAPVFYLARRPWWSADDWQAWLRAIVARRAPESAPQGLRLAQRHDLVAFLSALYVAVQEARDDEPRQRLLPGLREALRAVD